MGCCVSRDSRNRFKFKKKNTGGINEGGIDEGCNDPQFEDYENAEESFENPFKIIDCKRKGVKGGGPNGRDSIKNDVSNYKNNNLVEGNNLNTDIINSTGGNIIYNKKKRLFSKNLQNFKYNIDETEYAGEEIFSEEQDGINSNYKSSFNESSWGLESLFMDIIGDLEDKDKDNSINCLENKEENINKEELNNQMDFENGNY